jgi:hypothetical protein
MKVRKKLFPIKLERPFQLVYIYIISSFRLPNRLHKIKLMYKENFNIHTYDNSRWYRKYT